MDRVCKELGVNSVDDNQNGQIANQARFSENIWNLFVTLGKDKHEAINKALVELLAVLIDKMNTNEKLVCLESKSNYIY